MEKFWGALPYAGAILLLGLVGLFLFRANVGQLIDRIRKLGFVEAAPPQTPDPMPPPPPPQAQQLDSPEVTAFARGIESELDGRGVAAAPQSQRYSELLRVAAYARMNATFERAASQLFGSQLTLLKMARGAGNAVDPDRARAVFDKARTDYPEAYANKTYDVWLAFLESFELVTRSDTGRITLTERGVQFLLFFPATGHIEPDRL